MHYAKTSLFVCFLRVLLFTAFSQVYSQTILAPGITLYPGNLGLHQNTITCIYAQHNGQMWVSTFGGLHQFDGHSFRHVPLPGHLKLPANDVIRSMIESGDSLIIATETAILSYNPEAMRFTSLVRESRNTFTLLRVSAGLLYYYDFAKGALKTIQLKTKAQTVQYADGMVRQVYEMCYSNNHLYIKTKSNVVLRIDIKTGKQTELTTTSPIQQLVGVVPAGCIIATESSVDYYSAAGLVNLEDIAFLGYFSSAFLLDTELYLQRQDGWHRYSLDTNQHTFFSEIQLGMPAYLNGKTTAVMQDASGNIWMGKDGFGLLQFNRLFWQFNNGLSIKTRGNFVRSLSESHGKLWAGTQFFELLEIKPDTVIKHTFPLPQQRTAIHVIDSLNSEKLLLATEAGLWIYKITTQKFQKLRADGAEEAFSGMKKSGDHWLLSSANSTTLLSTRILGNAVLVDSQYTFPDYIRCFWPTPDGKVLVGLKTGGLHVLDLADGTISEVTGFADVQIIQIAPSHKEWLFATTIGVVRTDQSFNKLQQKGLSALETHSYAILPVSLYEQWVSTNSGLVFINEKNAQQYSSRNGLQSDEFNGRCALKLRNGQLAFGGVNGISIFHPDKIHADPIAPIPYLQHCANAGSAIATTLFCTNKPNFGEGRLNLQLHFDVTNYTLPEKNELAIALITRESADTVWQNLGDARDYYLQGLRADNYLVLAKAANADGLWGKEVLIGSFGITPIFYKSWWFIALLFFAAIGLTTYLIYLNAQRQQARRQAEHLRLKALAEMRQQIADDIHDDLGAGLTKLALMADRLALKKPNEATEIAPLGSVARNLTKSLKEVIWATKPENDNLCELQRHLIALISEMLADTTIELQLNVEDCKSPKDVSPMQRQHVFQIVREAVHNCIKHAQANTFWFAMKEENNRVTIKMKDDGVGFDKANCKKGNGSQTQLRRAAAIGASFTVYSQTGGPTELKLEFTL